MPLIDLLGLQLKDKATRAVLAQYDDTRITYIIDLHDNDIADYYEAKSAQGGFVLQIDADQSIYSIHCYVQPRWDFAPIDPALIGLPLYDTPAGVEAAGAALGATVRVRDVLSSADGAWQSVALEFGDRTRFYRFHEGALADIGFQIPGRRVPK